MAKSRMESKVDIQYDVQSSQTKIHKFKIFIFTLQRKHSQILIFTQPNTQSSIKTISKVVQIQIYIFTVQNTIVPQTSCGHLLYGLERNECVLLVVSEMTVNLR